MSTPTQILVQNLADVMDLIEEIDEVSKLIMAQNDDASLEAKVQAKFQCAVATLRVKIAAKTEALNVNLRTLHAVTYLKELEEIRGKGVWRNTAKNSHLVPALKPLRIEFPELDVGDAKLVLQAFQQELFD